VLRHSEKTGTGIVAPIRRTWEVIKFLREIDESGPAALVAAAEVFAVDVSRISTAVSYYGDYTDEIDHEIMVADEASMRAEHAWSVQQKLIA